jgi:hypothetical protein
VPCRCHPRSVQACLVRRLLLGCDEWFGTDEFRHVCAYFEEDYEDGRPKLSEAGRKALDDEARRVKGL